MGRMVPSWGSAASCTALFRVAELLRRNRAMS